MKFSTKPIAIFFALTVALSLALTRSAEVSANTGWLKAISSYNPAWGGNGWHSHGKTLRVPYDAYDTFNNFSKGPYAPTTGPFQGWDGFLYDASTWNTQVYVHWHPMWDTLYPPIPEVGQHAIKGDTLMQDGTTYLHRIWFNMPVPAGKMIGQVRLKRWSDNFSSWNINGQSLGIWGAGYPGDNAGHPENPLYINPDLFIPNELNVLAVGLYNDHQSNPAGNPVGLQYYLEYTLVDAPRTDLRLIKTVSHADTIAGGGETISWLLDVRNLSSVTAENVVVSDQLPAGLNFVSVSGAGWNCSYNSSNRIVTCTRPTLLGGMAASWIRINFTVPPNFRAGIPNVNPNDTVVTNTATVSTSTPESNLNNNSDSISLTVRYRADVSIEKTDTVDPVWIGNQFRYQLRIVNNGPSVARNLVVEDTLPAGLVYVGKQDPSNYCTYNSTNRLFRCTIAQMNPGVSRAVGIDVRVPENFQGNSVTNTAKVSLDTVDPNSSNNQDSETTTIRPRLDLELNKSDNPDPVVAGEQITWQIDVVNHGPSVAQNVLIRDTLPPGATVQSRTINRGTWSCTNNGSSIASCSGPSLGVGESVRMTIVAQVRSNHSAPLNNCAVVSNDIHDTNLANNEDCEPTAVNQEADLSIIKTGEMKFVGPGDIATYTLAVRNNGPSDAVNVVVTDKLPDPPSGSPPLVFVSAVGLGWNCSYSVISNEVTCTRPRIPGGENAPPITIEVRIPENFEGGVDIDNTACVTSDANDPVPGNNCDTETITILEVYVIGPPNGQFFVHVRNDIDPDRLERDYYSNEWIPGHLQTFVGVGFGFHLENAPLLCLTHRQVCPAEDSVYGHVIVNEYRITEIRKMDGDTVWSGDMTVEMNRYATLNPADCGGPSAPSERCIAKDLHTGNHAWLDPQEYVFLDLVLPGGNTDIDCRGGEGYRCIVIQDMMPGYYEISATVKLTVVFPEYPEYDDTYVMPVTGHLVQAVPRIND